MRFCVECGMGLSPVAAPAPMRDASPAAVPRAPEPRPPEPARPEPPRSPDPVRPPDAYRQPEPVLRQPEPVLRSDPIASAPSSNFNRTAPDSSRPPAMRAPESPPAAEARGAYGPSTPPGAHGAQPSAPTSGASDGKEARIVAILKDGSDGRSFPLHKDVIDLGRIEGDIVLSDDPYLSPRHARLTRRPESWLLRDLDSVNGVYVRIREPVDLSDGDMLLIGQQVLRFETLPDAELPLGPASLSGVLAFGTPEVPRIARLVQYTTEGIGRDLHYLYRDETVIGRENGDIVFTDDPFLSRRHAAITVDRSARRFVLRDLGSSNGTAMRFRGERTLASGDQFRIGRHLFRFEITRASPAGRA